MSVVPSSPLKKQDQRAIKKASVLVDFDNWYQWARPEVDESLLTQGISVWISRILQLVPNVDQIDIRFYGGWYEDFELTQRGSALSSVVQGIDHFPTPHPSGSGGLLRGSIALATELMILPSMTWGHTQRIRDGLPRLRLQETPTPKECAATDPADCPARNLYRFTKHKRKSCTLDGCTVLNSDAFKLIEQKMVDSLVICDLVSMISALDYRVVVVVSNDSDLIPGIAMAAGAASGVSIAWLRDVTRSLIDYDSYLESLGVALDPPSEEIITNAD